MADKPHTPSIILSGGRGCLARVLCEQLREKMEVITLSRTPGGRHIGIEDALIGGLIERVQTFIHLAWSTVPYTAEQNVGVEWTNDIPLLVRLLNMIVRLPRALQPHFIFFSSSGSLYGNAADRPFTERDICRPIGWYGHGKLAAERIVEEFVRRYAIRASILRISNPYGFTTQPLKPQGLIPKVVTAAIEGTRVSIWGDGTARKDFLYHSDFTHAMEQIILRQLEGTFNLCSGVSHSVNSVIRVVEDITGREVLKVNLPSFPWDVQNSAVSNEKLTDVLGWSPTVSLKDGIRRFTEAHSVAWNVGNSRSTNLSIKRTLGL
jgi:UDP-glucose 4-epimerase